MRSLLTDNIQYYLFILVVDNLLVNGRSVLYFYPLE
nr:MAG TPA: hypothetical protein [Bacteriophage sp.]